ncbi:MAG: nucleotide exchange factor GrpE [Clostridiales bacterium GWF2_36_10]|nr:MAG: nucleotide exchange factor GrpE [Clostridiales bacterium GWF2_36_10]
MENKKKINVNCDNNENEEVSTPLEEVSTVEDSNLKETSDKAENEEKPNLKLEKENENLKKELATEKDKYLRLFAEYENFRKRSQKEKSEIEAEVSIKAIINFLPLIDNMERAQEYAKDDEGMKVIIKQFADILKNIGVSVIESDGKTFDPNLHNAIMHEEDDSGEENKIVQTFQKGYMLGDKVIRHAMVKVIN